MTSINLFKTPKPFLDHVNLMKQVSDSVLKFQQMTIVTQHTIRIVQASSKTVDIISTTLLRNAVVPKIFAATAAFENSLNIMSAHSQRMVEISMATYDLNRFAKSFRSLTESLPLIESYIPPEATENANEAAAIVRQKKRPSFASITALLGLLISIYGAISSSLPNKQLDQLIEQNDTIISQQAELIELQDEDLILRNGLDILENSIYFLANEVNLICKNFKQVDDMQKGQNLSDFS